MKKSVLTTLIVIAIAVPFSVFSQTTTQTVNMAVGSKALISIIESEPVLLSLGGPTEAGAAVSQNTTHDKTRLRMSSLTAGTSKNKITAILSSEDGADEAWKWSNTRLEIELKEPINKTSFINYTNNASGLQGVKTLAVGIQATDEDGQTVGNPTGGLSPAQDLVKGIGTAWSGTGTNDGYVVEYTYTIENQALAPQAVNVTTVTFTIAADI